MVVIIVMRWWENDEESLLGSGLSSPGLPPQESILVESYESSLSLAASA